MSLHDISYEEATEAAWEQIITERDRARRHAARLDRKLGQIRQIAFDDDTITALEYGIVVDGGVSTVLTQGAVLSYAMDALRDIRRILNEVGGE